MVLGFIVLSFISSILVMFALAMSGKHSHKEINL